MSRRLLFLLCSARRDGNALYLARRAASPFPFEMQDWIDLTDPPLAAFADLRPAHAPPHGRAAEVMLAMQKATDIVFVAPIYWYALPAPAKLLLDHWSGWLDSPETGFADWARGLTVHLITTRADPDPSVADLPEAMLRRSVEWLGMRWGNSLHGVADQREDILADATACAAAGRLLHP